MKSLIVFALIALVLKNSEESPLSLDERLSKPVRWDIFLKVWVDNIFLIAKNINTDVLQVKSVLSFTSAIEMFPMVWTLPMNRAGTRSTHHAQFWNIVAEFRQTQVKRFEKDAVFGTHEEFLKIVDDFA